MDDEIEVTMVDGSTKKFKKDDLKAKMEQDMQGEWALNTTQYISRSQRYETFTGVKFDGETVTKESEGEGSLSELANSNPTMTRFIAIGRWYVVDSCVVFNTFVYKSHHI